LFAKVDGVRAQIAIKQSNLRKVKVDGKEIETPARVEASGQFVGTNVPLEVVRSMAMLFAVISQGLYGA
jgi:hypothetical protein